MIRKRKSIFKQHYAALFSSWPGERGQIGAIIKNTISNQVIHKLAQVAHVDALLSAKHELFCFPAVSHSFFYGLQGLNHHACLFPPAKPKALDFEVTTQGFKGFPPFEQLFSYS